MTERDNLPMGPLRLDGGRRRDAAQKVIAYARATPGALEPMLDAMRVFARFGGLEIVEEYSEEGKVGEAFSAAFHQLASRTDCECCKCCILVPHLNVLGMSPQEVRGRMAALRELDVPIYEVESGAVISWVSLAAVGAHDE